MPEDSLEALRNLAEDPFSDLRDVREALPAVLRAMSREADELADTPALCSLASFVDQVSRYVATLAANTPAHATPADPPPGLWEWRWPEELCDGDQIRFPAKPDGFGDWRTVTVLDRERRLFSHDGIGFELGVNELVQTRNTESEGRRAS